MGHQRLNNTGKSDSQIYTLTPIFPIYHFWLVKHCNIVGSSWSYTHTHTEREREREREREAETQEQSVFKTHHTEII